MNSPRSEKPEVPWIIEEDWPETCETLVPGSTIHGVMLRWVNDGFHVSSGEGGLQAWGSFILHTFLKHLPKRQVHCSRQSDTGKNKETMSLASWSLQKGKERGRATLKIAWHFLVSYI